MRDLTIFSEVQAGASCADFCWIAPSENELFVTVLRITTEMS